MERRVGRKDISDGDTFETTSSLTETHHREIPTDGQKKTPTTEQGQKITCGGESAAKDRRRRMCIGGWMGGLAEQDLNVNEIEGL